jgi:multidrug efflux pump subunit AcrA (membrane-fusion protein)
MRRNPKVLFPIVVILLGLISFGGYKLLTASAQSKALVVSGTIEATEVHVGTQLGGTIQQVYAVEGQPVRKGEVLAEVQPVSGVSAGYTEQIRSPLDGVVLQRVLEPGEIISATGTVVVVADLSSLNLTVYVPEDHLGQVRLGQQYPVAVDSFPGQAFAGTVSYIANQAEFTPRNVQTVEGRKITVFAVRLTIENPYQALKPGMPADVDLDKGSQ